METTLENDMVLTNENTQESSDSVEQFDTQNSVKTEEELQNILKFRDQLLAREILSCGVGTSDKVVHFGSGYKNSLIWEYLTAIKNQNLISEFGLVYTAVDADAQKINDISKMNAENPTGIDLRLVNNNMQSFIDSNTDEFDWSIITGIFNKNLYGESQFEFVDKIISSLLDVSTQGLIFTFNSSKELDEKYNINQLMNYVSSVYNRYRINRINEEDYIICIYKYYHSIIP